METLLTYNLKLSICYMLFYIVYRLLFSRETFHRSNRILLMSICIFITLIPTISFEIDNTHNFLGKIHEYQHALVEVPKTTVEIASTTSNLPIDKTIGKANKEFEKNINWTSILSFVYLIGIILLFVKLISSFARIVKLIYKHEKIKLKKGTLIILEKDIAPFSWFNYIFISQDDYNRNGEIIIRHEQAHIASHHSLDLIIVEVILIFQWYNPFIWLIKKELQNVHEFEADKLSIESGINAKEYQLLIIKEAVGPLRFKSITNNFNKNKTKKRITMMLKEKSRAKSRWKYLTILPLVIVSITLFAHTSNKVETMPKVNTIADSYKGKSIEGTWKLVKANRHDLSNGQSSIRIITKNNFSWTFSNAEGLIVASTGGKYTYEKGTYTEYLDYTSDTMSTWKGKTIVLKVEVRNNTMICKGLVDNQVDIDEVWVRVE